MSAQSNAAPVIIKRKKVTGGGGHHGGAWKVAYADFVTAMMAFFLLMWLLNATTEKQRKGVADYFSPAVPINRISGGGDGSFGGESVFSEMTLPQNGTGASNLRPTEANQARGELASLLSALNTNVAGRALFSGTATDTASFAPVGTFIAELKTAVAGEVTQTGILSAINDWFNIPGGGFETLGYLGSDTKMAPFSIGDGEAVDLDLTGDNQTIRELLKNTAIAALAADPELDYPQDLQSALLVMAGETLMTSQSGLVRIRADLGYAEERIEESRVRLSAEKTSLEMARSELLGVDLYEVATELDNVQTQLENLYAATARMSRLSLAEYL